MAGDLTLTRGPLKTIGEASIREPYKADRLTNRVRKMREKFGNRRFQRAAENRKARSNYKKRVPQRQDPRHKTGRAKGPQRLAPPKRGPFGRLRQR